MTGSDRFNPITPGTAVEGGFESDGPYGCGLSNPASRAPTNHWRFALAKSFFPLLKKELRRTLHVVLMVLLLAFGDLTFAASYK